MSSSKLLLVSGAPLLPVGSEPGQGAGGGVCFEALLWRRGCGGTWVPKWPQKEEARARGGEGPLTADSRSSRLPRP